MGISTCCEHVPRTASAFVRQDTPTLCTAGLAEQGVNAIISTTLLAPVRRGLRVRSNLRRRVGHLELLCDQESQRRAPPTQVCTMPLSAEVLLTLRAHRPYSRLRRSMQPPSRSGSRNSHRSFTQPQLSELPFLPSDVTAAPWPQRLPRAEGPTQVSVFLLADAARTVLQWGEAGDFRASDYV